MSTTIATQVSGAGTVSEKKPNKYVGKSPLQLSILRLRRNRLAMVSFWILMVYVVISIAGNFNVFGLRTAAMEFSLDNRYVAPFQTWQHIFGTDNFGRDVFARVIMGTRVSLFLGAAAGLLMVPLAIAIGSLSGYYGGFVDDIMMYVMSVVVAIPALLIIMSLVQIMGRTFFIIALAFAVTGWVGLARVIRGSFMQAREYEYVLAARCLGAGDARIIFKHIMPNLFHFVIVRFVLNYVGVIKSEVLLAYLGLSVIGVPSWGNMIDESKLELMANNWQNMIAATLFMFVFLVALNIFGDSLRDALDPKLKNVINRVEN
ncbi:MAG: ABC transporter permease [Spirochaetales bacterium]|nr:ABC transporter permease [Spirochaetales bacterium]